MCMPLCLPHRAVNICPPSADRHMDTTPDMTGKDVKPQVIHYEGGDVVLNREQGIVMEAASSPSFKSLWGRICLLRRDHPSGGG